MDKIKTALISVSNKTGIVEFAKELEKLKIQIISTGGTFKLLDSKGIKVTEIDKVTEFPEILDGRVKTLNPKIHGGILAIRSNKNHMNELKKYSIKPIDIVVVNLYPFEETLEKIQSKEEKIPQNIIENIDIGGVTLLRASAKNFEDVIVVCDINDYTKIIEMIKSNKITYEFRKELAAKAFRHTAYYDSLISNYFSTQKFTETITIGLKKVSELRYGENPHQKASLYKNPISKFEIQSLTDAVQLQGKELSYNNYLDLDSAWTIVNEFDSPACVIIKHNNPCGVAESKDILSAYKNALICDPVSAFGGIIAFNRIVDEPVAKEIVKLFTECIIAPGYTDEAKQILNTKKDLRVMVLALPEKKNIVPIDYRTISGGMLVQDKDVTIGLENIKCVTERKPTDEELTSLKFAWKICKNVKSNAIILVRGTQTVGIGAGQMSRIDSVKIANIKMKSIENTLDKELLNQPLVLASDAFFPFRDVPDMAAQIGVKAIIQPGGSLKDADSIKSCNENKIAMVFTGIRHFKH